MAREKDQKMRYNSIELGLIKTLFADNDDLLFAWRKHMLGVALPAGEKKLLEVLRTGPAFELAKKALLPYVDGDAPFFTLMDLGNGLNVDMKSKPPEEIMPLIAARAIEQEYLENRYTELSTGKAVKGAITLESLGNIKGATALDIDAYVRLSARNHLLSHIDSFINDVRNLAGTKKESVEETMKRLGKNSTK